MLVQQNGCYAPVVQLQQPTQHLITYQIPSSQQPPSYESLSAVKAPPTYNAAPTNEPVPTVLTQLLTSSQGVPLLTMQQPVVTSSAVVVPDVVLISAAGTAVTQSTSNIYSASLPRPQFELRAQPQSQPDITSQSAADFIALTSGQCHGHLLLFTICLCLSVCLSVCLCW